MSLWIGCCGWRQVGDRHRSRGLDTEKPAPQCPDPPHLEGFDREFDYGRFIPKEATLVFTAEDNKDATHVQAGPRTDAFVERALEQLDASPTKREGP